MFKLEGLTKSYQGKTIIRVANFEARPGQMTVIYGPSGIGKSTLLDIIAGLKTFQERTYLWKNQNLSQVSDEARSRFRGNSMAYISPRFCFER